MKIRLYFFPYLMIVFSILLLFNLTACFNIFDPFYADCSSNNIQVLFYDAENMMKNKDYRGAADCYTKILNDGGVSHSNMSQAYTGRATANLFRAFNHSNMNELLDLLLKMENLHEDYEGENSLLEILFPEYTEEELNGVYNWIRIKDPAPIPAEDGEEDPQLGKYDVNSSFERPSHPYYPVLDDFYYAYEEAKQIEISENNSRRELHKNSLIVASSLNYLILSVLDILFVIHDMDRDIVINGEADIYHLRDNLSFEINNEIVSNALYEVAYTNINTLPAYVDVAVVQLESIQKAKQYLTTAKSTLSYMVLDRFNEFILPDLEEILQLVKTNEALSEGGINHYDALKSTFFDINAANSFISIIQNEWKLIIHYLIIIEIKRAQLDKMITNFDTITFSDIDTFNDLELEESIITLLPMWDSRYLSSEIQSTVPYEIIDYIDNHYN